MLKPNDVFTPGHPPINLNNVYAHRGQHEKDFIEALNRSLVPVVFGEYGVGKTSMARHSLLQAERERRLVNVESVDGKSFSDLIKLILEHLGYEVTRTTTVQHQTTGGRSATAESGIAFAGLNAKMSGQLSDSETNATTAVRELAVASPTDGKVIDVCEANGIILLVDEMHRGEATLIHGLSAFIKAVSNRPCKRFKIVLLGTASDASRLVDHDPGIDRIIQEIPLPSLVVAEATTIIEEGMTALAVVISKDQIANLVKMSVGSPALVQYLSLEVAEAAFGRTPREVKDHDLPDALRSYIRKRAKRLELAYLKAIETTGSRRYRKQVLLAMANLDSEYVTMDQLVEQVSSRLDEDVQSTALSGPLRALKTKDFGEILRDVERSEGGARVFNYTTFSDPAMRAFIRMRYVGETEGIFDDSETS